MASSNGLDSEKAAGAVLAAASPAACNVHSRLAHVGIRACHHLQLFASSRLPVNGSPQALHACKQELLLPSLLLPALLAAAITRPSPVAGSCCPWLLLLLPHTSLCLDNSSRCCSCGCCPHRGCFVHATAGAAGEHRLCKPQLMLLLLSRPPRHPPGTRTLIALYPIVPATGRPCLLCCYSYRD